MQVSNSQKMLTIKFLRLLIEVAKTTKKKLRKNTLLLFGHLM